MNHRRAGTGRDGRAAVAIVGGGPVGMLLAAELAARGVDVVVLERQRSTRDEPRAGTLHARTLQGLRRRGWLGPDDGRGGGAPHDATRPGRPVRATARAPFHLAGQWALELEAPAAEGPPRLDVPQAALERRFEAAARAHGARLLRGHAVVAVHPEGDGARVVATADGTTCTVRARWVVGCDGARSAVREQAGIGVRTWPPTVAALLALVRVPGPDVLPRGWRRTPRGWTVVSPRERGLCRLITFDFAGPAPDRHRPLGLDELRATTSRIVGRDVPLSDLAFASRFSDVSRLADTLRSGPFVLAGDAAHVHFPVGGQGLNLGLQDALALGWRLAAIVRSGADADGLLTDYDDERRAAASGVIALTRAQRALMDPRDRAAPLRALVPLLLGADQPARRIGRLVSGQTVRGVRRPHEHPATGTFVPDLAVDGPDGPDTVAGLLRRGRPLLVDWSGDASCATAAAWAGALTVARGRTPVPGLGRSLVLVRPDGYVAWVGTGATPVGPELRDALTRWVGPPPSRTADPPTLRVSVGARPD